VLADIFDVCVRHLILTLLWWSMTAAAVCVSA